MIDYHLAAGTSGEVTIEIKDAKGNLVRRHSSSDQLPPPDAKEMKVPAYWARQPQPLSATPGLHRFLWDMHLPPIAGVDPEYPIAAIRGNTAPEPTSPWAMPGEYTVVLTANGTSYTQPLTIKMDPRVKATPADLAQQFDLSKKLYDARITLHPIGKSYDALNGEVAKAKERSADKPVAQQLDAFAKTLADLALPPARPGAPLSFSALAKVESLFGQLQDVDAAPRPSVKAAVADVLREAEIAKQRWGAIMSDELPALNRRLEAAGVEKIVLNSEAH
jgi:hypothetical protein